MKIKNRTFVIVEGCKLYFSPKQKEIIIANCGSSLTIIHVFLLTGLGQLHEVDGSGILGRPVIERLGREKDGPLGRVCAVPEHTVAVAAEHGVGEALPSPPSRPLPQHAAAASAYPDACGSARASRVKPKELARE